MQLKSLLAVRMAYNLRRRGIWKHLIPGVIIGGIALYLTYRKTDTAQLMGVLREMQWPVLLLVLIPLFVSYAFRIIRWRFLLSPISDVPLKKVAGPLITGFFVNSLLPGRVGEVLRALLLSRKTSIPKASSFASVVLARIFDGLTLAAMTLIVLTVFWSNLDRATRMGLIAAGLAYLLVLLMLIALRRWKEGSARLISAPLRLIGLKSLSFRSHGSIRSWCWYLPDSVCLFQLLQEQVRFMEFLFLSSRVLRG